MSEKILITGVQGFLGDHLARAFAQPGRMILGAVRSMPQGQVPWTPVPLDLADAACSSVVSQWQPALVVHAAAMAKLDQCEREAAAAFQVNAVAAESLAARAHAVDAEFVLISTDQVFDGERGMYREDDPARPINVYGQSKLEGEERVRRAHRSALIVRLPLLFGPSATGDRGASDALGAMLRRGERPRLFTDEYRSPVDVRDGAAAIVRLRDRRAKGIWHLGGPERMHRFALGSLVARHLGLDASLIQPARSVDHPGPRRPLDASLDSSRAAILLGAPLRSPRDALEPR